MMWLDKHCKLNPYCDTVKMYIFIAVRLSWQIEYHSLKYKEEVIRPLVEPVSADTTDASLSFNEFLKVFVVVNMILIFVNIVFLLE